MAERVLITGASSGLGAEFARIFAREGYDLVLVARSLDKMEALRQELSPTGVEITVIPMDLAKVDAAKELLAKTEEAGLPVDILINNAGFGHVGPLVGSDWSRQKEMMDLNMEALVQLTYEFGGRMQERGHGRILNIASIAAFCPGPYMSLYYASKSFVLSFSQAVAEELKNQGITVTALCLGPAKTGFEAAANLQESRMFSFFKPDNAAAVANTGYKALMRGKVVAFHGAVCYGSNLLSRIAPRIVARKFSKWINSSRF